MKTGEVTARRLSCTKPPPADGLPLQATSDEDKVSGPVKTGEALANSKLRSWMVLMIPEV
jgi:hypothetical protein